MIICAGEKEQFPFAVPMGIGLIDVAMNLTQYCMVRRPEFILFVGTAGSYGKHKLFDIIESESAANIENSFFNAGSYSPINNMLVVDEDVSRETIVNSSNFITTDIRLGKAYLEKGIGLENMEFYAILKVAQKFRIPAGGIFIITNYCDEYAHQDFIKNHQEAMQRLTQYIEKQSGETV